MREDEFRKWMEAQGAMQKRPIGDAVSRCRRIEAELQVNLAREFEEDGGRTLLDTLTYTREDEAQGRPAPGGLRIASGANIYNAVSSVRSAARKYFEFCGN